jgi:hypothetical protein
MPQGQDGSSQNVAKNKRKRSQPKDQSSKKPNRVTSIENNPKVQPSVPNTMKDELELRGVSKLAKDAPNLSDESFSSFEDIFSSDEPMTNKAKARTSKGSTSARASTSINDMMPFMGGMLFSMPGLMGSVPPRIKKAIDCLSSSSKANQIIKSLEDLNEFMMMSFDDVAFRIRVDQLVPLLIRHMGSLHVTGPGDDPMRRAVLCSQILSVLLDSSPAACDAIVKSSENISVLCSHISNIPLIELADQCVVVLSRLSKDHQRDLIMAGSLGAISKSIEFLCMSTQRQCTQILTDLLTMDSADITESELLEFVRQVIPRLAELFTSHPDPTVAEKAGGCWRNAVEMCPSFSLEDLECLIPILNMNKPVIASHVLEGLEFVARKDSTGEISSFMAKSESFIENSILEPLKSRTELKHVRSILSLVTSLLPNLKVTKNRISLELSDDRPFSTDLSNLLDRVFDLVLDHHGDQVPQFVIHLGLLLSLSGKVDGEKINPLILQVLTSAESPELVFGALCLLDHFPSDLHQHSIVDLLRDMKSKLSNRVKTRRSRPAPVVELIDRILSRNRIGGDRSPLKWISFEHLLAAARTNLTEFELKSSNCVDKLEQVLMSCTSPEELRHVVENDMAGTDKLISLLVSLVDHSIETQPVKPNESSSDILCGLLQRPIRLGISREGSERKLMILVDPLMPLSSVSKMLQNPQFDEDEISEEEEDQVEINPSMSVKVNGIHVDQSLCVMEAVMSTKPKEPDFVSPVNFRSESFRPSPAQIINLLGISGESKTETGIERIIAESLWGSSHGVELVPSSSHSSNKECPTFEAKEILYSEDEEILSDLKRVSDGKLNRLVKVLGMLSVVTRRTVVCPKMSLAVIQAYKDPLRLVTGKYPQCMQEVIKHTPWLLSLAAKREVIGNFFDIHRTIQYKFSSVSGIPAVPRQKVSIRRDQVLVSALVMMAKVGATYPRLSLEVAFDGEEGTGSGPTNEFYSLAIDELKNSSMFRTCPDGTLFPSIQVVQSSDLDRVKDVFDSPQLFVLPGISNVQKKLVQWRLLGMIVGRGILDARLIDLEMSPLFWSLVKQVSFGEPVIVSSHRLAQIEPALVQSLEAMTKMTEAELESLEIDGSTLPGFADFKLKGSDCGIVTKESLENFKKSIAEAHLFDGIIHQVREFSEGFMHVVSRDILALIAPDEMSSVLGGSSVLNDNWWRPECILASIRADHGYTLESKQVIDFVEIMSQLSPEDRLKFVRFVTGARTLPPGGCGGLRPPLTIVKAVKSAEEGHPDNFLPSVMTCANFVKVPEYSGKEIMRAQLMKAINEGQNSFLLS